MIDVYTILKVSTITIAQYLKNKEKKGKTKNFNVVYLLKRINEYASLIFTSKLL